eukprot:UN11544
MTGVGGRPELIVEGTESNDGPWEEIHFLYKPTDLNDNCPFIVPHQPRIDWQIWFAALRPDYRHSPWMLSLVARLLQGSECTINLLDKNRYKFIDNPPKYIRVLKYTYIFTNPEEYEDTKAIWKTNR